MEYYETTTAKKQAKKPDCTDKNVLIKKFVVIRKLIEKENFNGNR